MPLNAYWCSIAKGAPEVDGFEGALCRRAGHVDLANAHVEGHETDPHQAAVGRLQHLNTEQHMSFFVQTPIEFLKQLQVRTSPPMLELHVSFQSHKVSYISVLRPVLLAPPAWLDFLVVLARSERTPLHHARLILQLLAPGANRVRKKSRDNHSMMRTRRSKSACDSGGSSCSCLSSASCTRFSFAVSRARRCRFELPPAPAPTSPAFKVHHPNLRWSQVTSASSRMSSKPPVGELLHCWEPRWI